MNRRPARRLRTSLALAATLAWPAFVGAAGLASRCIEDDGSAGPPSSAAAADAATPRLALQALVRRAIARSQAIGAARLLADASAAEVDEVRAGGQPQIGLSGNVGLASTMWPGSDDSHGAQGRLGLNLSALLYDGGRLDELTGWRKNLAEAARLGEITAEEQVALQTVSLALDRGRYGLQVLVYRQYARRLECLVGGLEQIVDADKGRASELVQARKNLQQAELAQAQTLSTVRLIETRLRRYVGDELPSADGVSSLLRELPPLERLQADAERSAPISQLSAQAAAAESYTRSVAASRRPQLNWVVSGSTAAGAGRSSNLSVGLNVNVPLYEPALVHTVDAAQARAGAARLQRDDAVEALRFRINEVHEQAVSAFDRARRVEVILRDSNVLRNATLLQWQQLGRRSLFDVIGAEGDHYGLRVAHVNAIADAQQANALLRSLGLGLGVWLDQPGSTP